MEKILVLSPSSYGLQPYKFLLVQDPAVRQQLTPASWNQPQIEECSHYVVFAGRRDMTEADVATFVGLIAQTRGLPETGLADYKNMMVGDLVKGPRHAIAAHWAARQAYIALGNLLTSAALLGVDACPMEGFNPEAYDEILGLKASPFQALCSCALGYRSAADKYQTLKKVRFDKKNLIQIV